MSVNDDVDWPPKLLEIVQRHLHAVEDEQFPSLPPVYSATDTVYNFFVLHRPRIAAVMESSGIERGVTDCCVNFVVSVLEQACGLSFLLPRERRMVTNAAIQRERRMRGGGGGGRGGGAHAFKKRRIDEPDHGIVHAKFAHVLTLEYLLRLFISLPLILEHYDKLGGSVLPAFSKRPLWAFVNATLRVLDENQQLFSPLNSYVPLR